MTSDDRDARRREVVILVALKTGLLRRCAVHDVVYDPGQHDYQGACMMTAFMMNQGDPLVAEFQGNRVSLTELLKTICQGYGMSCPQCGSPAVG